jgi:hypothetical protein
MPVINAAGMPSNPYESPRAEQRSKNHAVKRTWWHIAIGVTLMVAALPVALYSAVVCACASYFIIPGIDSGPVFAWALIFITGGIPFYLMMWAGICWIWPKKKY